MSSLGSTSVLSDQAEAAEETKRVNRILGADKVIFAGQNLELIFEDSSPESLVPQPEDGTVLLKTSDRRRARELVRRWFLKESSGYVVRKVKEFAPVMGVKPARVDVREMRSWGYCTRTGRVSFSWQLIALPEKLREYVVLHELTHLKEFNHGRAFKANLGSVCPDFRERERDLYRYEPYDHLAKPF